MSFHQLANSSHDVDLTPARFICLVILLMPAAVLATIWVIASLMDVMGLPGGDLAANFMRSTLWLQIFTLIYVVTVSAIVCTPSDPVSARRAMRWAFTAILLRHSPRVVHFLEALGGQTTALPALATPRGMRSEIRPQPPIPTFGFSPGASPQIE